MQHNTKDDTEHVTCSEKQFKCYAPPHTRDAHNPKNPRQVSGAWPLQPSNWRFQVLAVNFVISNNEIFRAAFSNPEPRIDWT